MRRTVLRRVCAVFLAVCLMVLTTVCGASALGTRSAGTVRIAEETAKTAGFDLSAYAEKLTDLLDVEPSGDVQADVGTLLTNAKLYNLLLVGVDSRKDDYTGRSDAMMVLTVNPVEKKVVLTSLLRDSYVSIPGHGKDRLNAAYDLGGISLLKKTIKQNYGIKLNGFVVVNFKDLIDFVDDIGGVMLNVSEEEIKYVNRYTASQNKELYGKKTNPDALPVKSGDVRLNGMQALAYARIRYVGLDFGRTWRQRQVIASSLDQLFTLPLLTQVQIVAKYMLRVKTDITVPELLYLVLVYATIEQYETTSMALPVAGTYTGKRISGKDVLVVDLPANRAAWNAAVGA